MSGSPAVAINEGVSLLDSIAPGRLAALRKQLPNLASQLDLGIDAGARKEQTIDPLLEDKARFMVETLNEASTAARQALRKVSSRILTARRQRLFSQLLVLIGSSSSLATLALSKNRAAVIAAVLTLIAAVGNLIAEHQEKLLNAQAGNIYELYEKLSEAVYQARILSTEIELALKYREGAAELRSVIAKANLLCETMNKGVVQVVTTGPFSGASERAKGS